ncbi:MAG: patatin-like phospholipase family protein, partial [Bacteroidetes bacterium]
GYHTWYELSYETHSWQEILSNCLGFLIGVVALIGLVALYLQFTNKDILSFLQITDETQATQHARVGPGKGTATIEDVRLHRTAWSVKTYLTESLRLRPVRSVHHYDTSLLVRVFRQNHLNALRVQLYSIAVIILLGLLIDNPYFRIPAAASIFIMASIIMGLLGAIIFWFHRWTLAAFIGMLILLNFLTRLDLMHPKNQAYGLNYTTPDRPEYSYAALEQLCRPENAQADKDSTEAILNRWLARRQAEGDSLPHMIVLGTSGGGLKAALWAMHVWQQLDSITAGAFTKHTVLVSGASGGMMGAAYYRELYLRHLQGEPVDPGDRRYLDYISKDLLNSISFTIVSNDLFLPWVKFEEAGYTYRKDRGYVFEMQLNENTGYLLDKALSDYWLPEHEALIPMLFVTPSIVNDGRRLIISPHSVAHMMAPPIAIEKPDAVEIDAVDFMRLLEHQDAANLRFTSALRMNATYPYVLPDVFLPTRPMIEVLDAGFRDNFGIKTAVRFLHAHKDWIKQHTSGVTLVVIRAYGRHREMLSSEHRGVIETMLNPLGIAFNIMKLQEFEHDTNLGLLYDLFGPDHFDVLRFVYLPGKLNKESPISFHLTRREKVDILSAMDRPHNQRTLHRLLERLSLQMAHTESTHAPLMSEEVRGVGSGE